MILHAVLHWAAVWRTMEPGEAAVLPTSRLRSAGSQHAVIISPPRCFGYEDKYGLRDLLGSGTCGEVQRAIHRRTGEEQEVLVVRRIVSCY